MAQHITLDEVKAACRKLYCEGRLLAQQTTRECGYQRIINGIDYRCAIGAVLSDDTLEEIHRRSLNTAGLCLIDCVTYSNNEATVLFKIMYYHDLWKALFIKRDKEEMKNKFCNLIGITL